MDKPFLLPIEGTYSIAGRGTVVTGRIERGVAIKGNEVEILGLGSHTKTVLTGIGAFKLRAIEFKPYESMCPSEMFHKELDRGEAGDNAGFLLRGIKRDDVKRGQVLAAPGSLKPHKKFLAKTYVRLYRAKMLMSSKVLLDSHQGRRRSSRSFPSQLPSSTFHPDRRCHLLHGIPRGHRRR